MIPDSTMKLESITWTQLSICFLIVVIALVFDFIKMYFWNNTKKIEIEINYMSDTIEYINNYITMGIFNSTNPKPDEYWIGPYNMLVDNSVERVMAEDDVNTITKSGGKTEIGLVGRNNMNKQKYLAKYAEFRSDGYYHYIKPVDEGKNDWWKGPYDVILPVYVTDAIMPDQFNLIDKWGNKTNHVTNNQILNKEEYLAKYAVLGQNGEYYYK